MGYVGTNFHNTDPTEVELYTFGFARILAAGERITGAAFAVAIHRGDDPDPASRMVGIAIISGMDVSQLVGPLLSGATYRLSATVVTSLGQTLTLHSHVACVPLD